MIGWPQLLTLALIGMSFGITLACHGEERPRYNVFAYILEASVYLALLCFGGFFNGNGCA